MRTGSAFEALVNAIQNPNLVGEDSPLFPLPHAGLKLLIDNEARMVQFLQRKFRFRDSQAKLSDDEARDLALNVVGRLRSGALLLQPHTLARACYDVSVASSPTHGVPWPTFACPYCGYPPSTALSPRPSRYVGAQVAAARGWRRCTRSPHRCGSTAHITRPPARMLCVTCTLCWFAILAVLGFRAGAPAWAGAGTGAGAGAGARLAARAGAGAGMSSRPRLIS